MTEDRTQLPETIRRDTPDVPLAPGVPFYYDAYTMDNVQRAHAPSGLMPTEGGAGDTTEWDASSLEQAIDWLESHADFLNKQSYKMAEDIEDWMGGKTASGPGGGGKSPLGSFQRAGDLAEKHGRLYTSTQTDIRQLAKDLYKAANALRKVKEDYETAEHANAMSAAEMERAFGTASSNTGKN